MWGEYRITFQDHVKYIRNSVVKTCRFVILQYAEHIHDMHVLSKYIPTPLVNSMMAWEGSWVTCPILSSIIINIRRSGKGIRNMSRNRTIFSLSWTSNWFHDVHSRISRRSNPRHTINKLTLGTAPSNRGNLVPWSAPVARLHYHKYEKKWKRDKKYVKK